MFAKFIFVDFQEKRNVFTRKRKNVARITSLPRKRSRSNSSQTGGSMYLPSRLRPSGRTTAVNYSFNWIPHSQQRAPTNGIQNPHTAVDHLEDLF